MNGYKVYNLSLFDRFSRLWSSCVLCDQPSGRHLDLCLSCESSLPWLANPCPRCAFPNMQASDHCAECQQREPLQRRTISLFHYEFPLNRLIGNFKYHQRFEYGHLLADLLALYIAKNLEQADFPEAIVPIPLHKTRQIERGYNQAMLLAKQIGKRLHIPVVHSGLEKIKHTTQQATLNAEQRKHNLADAFRANSQIKLPKRVAIIDDVYTTGATSSAAITALRAEGISEIDLWTIARTD